MTDNELKRMSRADLLEILLAQSREIERLRDEVAELNDRLEEREILMSRSGSIAEASLRLNRVFEAAQKAQEECELEKDLVGDAMREEYLKYNIDPENPDAHKLLLMAKSREQTEARKAKEDAVDTLPPGADIF